MVPFIRYTHFLLRNGACLAERPPIAYQASNDNKKQACCPFKNFRSQNPTNSEAVCGGFRYLADSGGRRVSRYLAAFLERIVHFCEAESLWRARLRLMKATLAPAASRAPEAEKPGENCCIRPVQTQWPRLHWNCSWLFKGYPSGHYPGPCRTWKCYPLDGWRGYDGIVDIGYQKHFRVEHGNNKFANKHSHINGVESFWAFAKNGCSFGLKGWQNTLFASISKDVNFVLIIETKISTISCSECSEKNLSARHAPKKLISRWKSGNYLSPKITSVDGIPQKT